MNKIEQTTEVLEEMRNYHDHIVLQAYNNAKKMVAEHHIGKDYTPIDVALISFDMGRGSAWYADEYIGQIKMTHGIDGVDFINNRYQIKFSFYPKQCP